MLLTYNYLDAPSALQHREALAVSGYLPSMPFNRVLTLALALAGLDRRDVCVTHAFHLLPARRSASIPARDIDISFDEVARHELAGRRVIALGTAAAGACRRHGVAARATAHPSARGQSFRTRAEDLARALAS